MCDLDAVRDAAEKEAEARVLGDRGEALGYSVEEAFADGAVWLAGKLPTRDEIAAVLARSMPGWSEETEDGPLTYHWEAVNAMCIESGKLYADMVLALIQERIKPGAE